MVWWRRCARENSTGDRLSDPRVSDSASRAAAKGRGAGHVVPAGEPLLLGLKDPASRG